METQRGTPKIPSRKVSTNQMMTTIRVLKAAKNFSSYVKKKFGGVISRFSVEGEPREGGETGRSSKRVLRGSALDRFSRLNSVRENGEFEDHDPEDNKGLVSMFWKRNEMNRNQEIVRMAWYLPEYSEMGPPSYLESIGHSNVILKGAQVLLTDKKRLQKVMESNKLHSFVGYDEAQAKEIHLKNMDLMSEMLGEFMVIINTTSWLFNNNYASYFNRKEYNFLKAIGDFAVEAEVIQKRKENLSKAKEIKDKFNATTFAGREYIKLKQNIVALLSLLLTIIEEINEFDPDEEMEETRMVTRRNRILANN